MTMIASMWTSASRVLSDRRLLACLAGAAFIAANEPPALAGMWGAGDATLALDAQGGRLQSGCTLLRFAPIHLGTDGSFSTAAQVDTLSAMPPAEEEAGEPTPRAATLAGRIGGGAADLVITVNGEAPRSLHLILGQRATPARCL